MQVFWPRVASFDSLDIISSDPLMILKFHNGIHYLKSKKIQFKLKLSSKTDLSEILENSFFIFPENL